MTSMLESESFDVAGPVAGKVAALAVTSTSAATNMAVDVNVGADFLAGRTLRLTADGCKIYYAWASTSTPVADTATGATAGKCGMIPDGGFVDERLSRSEDGKYQPWLSVKAASGASGILRLHVRTQNPICKYRGLPEETAPTITSISPAFGSTLGDSVPRTIRGTRFTGKTFTLDGAELAATIVDDTTATVAGMPAKAAGAYDVSIVGVTSTASLVGGYHACTLGTWLMAANVTLGEGTEALQINDLSGNGRHVTFTAGSGPAYMANDWQAQGKPGLNFAGDKTGSLNWGAGKGGSHAWVARATADTSARYGWLLYDVNYVVGWIANQMYGSFGGVDLPYLQGYGWNSNTFTWTKNGLSSRNNLEGHDGGTADGSTGAFDVLSFGSQGGSQFFGGIFNELVMCEDPADAAFVRADIQRRYGSRELGTTEECVGLAGSPGYTDGVGSAARLDNPYFMVWVPSKQLVYFSNQYYPRVSTLDPSTNTVATVCGNGTEGAADGIGAAARFKEPSGMVYDGANYIYLTDIADHTVRRIDVRDNSVTTVAGSAGVAGNADGIGIAATLTRPWGIDLYDGHLYVCSSGSGLLRKVRISDWNVTTVAGAAGVYGNVDGIGSAARFEQFIGGIAIVEEGGGPVGYITDTGTTNDYIRRIDLRTNSVTTVAGGARGTSSGVDMDGRFYHPCNLRKINNTTLLHTDSLNNKIRLHRMVGGHFVTGDVVGLGGTAFGWGTAGRLDHVIDICYVAELGGFYITDNYNDRIVFTTWGPPEE